MIEGLLKKILDKLLGTITVVQDAKDRTVTNIVDIAPTGDIARKQYYDRNSSLEIQYYGASNIAAHGETVRWTYTVPTDKKALHSVIYGQIAKTIATAGRVSWTWWQGMKSGGSWLYFSKFLHTDTSGFYTYDTITVTFALNEGDAVRGGTGSNDTVVHNFTISSLLTEFDE